MSDRPSRVKVTSPACFSSLRWKASVADGSPSSIADLAGGETPLPRLHKQPIDIEAGFLSERRQGREHF